MIFRSMRRRLTGRISFRRALSVAVYGFSEVPCYSPLKGFVDYQTGGLTFDPRKHSGTKMEVACGQCLGCRLDNARMWSMRIIHEASLHELDGGNSFITLTYEDPGDWSLHKKHFQDFMKRLRKKADQKIRFFHCGEYGSFCRHGLSVDDCACNVGRPHYHAILFNISFNDKIVCGQRKDITYFTSPSLEETWGKGFVTVGDCTMQSANYVARYCLKKVNGLAANDHYTSVDEDGVLQLLDPEYSTMSRRPGIGKEWFDQYKGDLFPSDEVPVPGEGVFKKVPRYYANAMEALDPKMIELIKERRQKYRKENIAEFTPERLRDKYKVKAAQVGQLRRSLE